ncbi:MAG TPA: hypothetical protein VK874_02890, partial [Gaiellaceae bacterium]|nr:hypothetical protein [Gaiellaceae bacterium]
MPRRKRTRKLRPKTPARIRKKKRQRAGTRSHHHPELWGLVLLALGVFLGSVLYLGWDGGVVGGAVADAVLAAIGWGAYVAPPALAAVGLLMVGRSGLVDVRPFRTGLAVAVAGGLLTLGEAHGGGVGGALERASAWLLGDTGAAIVGATALAAGLLLLSGASAGAILRRSGHALRQAHTRASTGARRADRPVPAYDPQPGPPPAHLAPPVDAEHDFPDLVSDHTAVAPPPLLVQDEDEATHDHDEHPSLFDARPPVHGEYRLPDRSLLRRGKGVAAASAD